MHRLDVSLRFSHGLQFTLLGVMIRSLRSMLYLLLCFSFFYDTAQVLGNHPNETSVYIKTAVLNNF